MRQQMAFVAMDSFKGSLSTFEAGEAAAAGLRRCGFTQSQIKVFPMSDGGEGFCDVVASYLSGRRVNLKVRGPLGDEVASYYFLASDGTAYIESALSCGYTLVPGDLRNPLRTSSFGLGQTIRHAAESGAGRIIIGLGGTATCDGGLGALQALGAKFYISSKHTDSSRAASSVPAMPSDDLHRSAGRNASSVGFGTDAEPDRMGPVLLPDGFPALLQHIHIIDASFIKDWHTPVELWVDTGARMCGPGGAVRMYGPQKGLPEAELNSADTWMYGLSLLYRKYLPGIFKKRLWRIEGTGAAGGIAGALHAMLGAKILYGAEQMIYLSKLREQLALSDISNKAQPSFSEAKASQLDSAAKVSPSDCASQSSHPDCASQSSHSETTDVFAPLVITGEGHFDVQTLTGKLPSWVALAAREAGARSICLCGRSDFSTQAATQPLEPSSAQLSASSSASTSAQFSASSSARPSAPDSAADCLKTSGVSDYFDSIIPITPAGMPLEQALDKRTASALLASALAAGISAEYLSGPNAFDGAK